MDPTKDIIFDVSTVLPVEDKNGELKPREEKVTFVNVSYEKIERALYESLRVTNAKKLEDAKVLLKELADQLNKTGINTISWRGVKMKMNFSVE